MFGQNEIVGLKYFKYAEEDTLLITSMFFSIQGEGPFSGKPSYFIRLAKCNLACSFCDTAFDKGDWMTTAEILERIDQDITKWFRKEIDHIVPDWAKAYSRIMFETDVFKYKRDMVLVITGGEPSLQKNLSKFLAEATAQFKHIQIESNGTIEQTILELPEHVTVVVSPKCHETNGKPIKYLKPTDAVLERASCLKFVMGSDTNSPYSYVPAWALDWKERGQPYREKEIFVSPMNIYKRLPLKMQMQNPKEHNLDNRSTIDETVSFWEEGLLDNEQNQKNHEYAARYCMIHGLRFQLQTHLYASLP